MFRLGDGSPRLVLFALRVMVRELELPALVDGLLARQHIFHGLYIVTCE
jgi:hypothetical protein